MTFQYNDKGKYFTNFVAKDAVPAVIQTITHRIHGFVHVRQGERLKDELDESSKFLAITDAQVFDTRGQVIYKSSFLVIHRDHLVWLMPDEETQENPNRLGRLGG